MTDALRVLIVLALIAGNAFFVVAEYAVVTARRSKLAQHGGRRAAAALRLMDDPVRVISTVQVGITALGIVTGAVAEPLVGELIGDAIPRSVSFVLAFAVVTYLSVVLGELVPKALALDRAERLAMMVARPVEVIGTVLRPVVWLLQKSARVLLKPFGIDEVVAGDAIRTAEELRALVDEAESSGVIPLAQEELLHNVFDFADREARDIMVPAPDVAWLDVDLDPRTALEQALATAHSRLLVCRGSVDGLVGVVGLRDLVAATHGDEPPATIEPLARTPHVVPETKDLGVLLRELREAHQSLAVVINEYGGTEGVVSIEDILEEIVGEIEDEYDLPDPTITWVDDRTVTVAGSLTIDDFNETMGTELPQESARTLAGLVFTHLGRRPVVGDELTAAGADLRVAEVDGARITRLRIVLPETARGGPSDDSGPPTG
jgi:putative hemolysin